MGFQAHAGAAVKAALLLISVLAGAPLAAQSHLVVVSGLSGEPEYAAEWGRWGAAMTDAARTRYGLRPEQVVYLAEHPERDPGRVREASTRANLDRALAELAGRAGAGDAILILLIGHGSADDAGARLNLPGPDLGATDLARMLGRFPTQRLVVVNTASASGDWADALAGPNRVIITATRSGMERNQTTFGRFFVDAFAGAGADTDKDGRASVLEAFEYAQREVERHYKAAGFLQTEHAQLAGDREAIRGLFLAAEMAALPAASTPEMRALLEERQRLQNQVELLKGRKAGMEPARYLEELEQALVQLALKTREIRQREQAR